MNDTTAAPEHEVYDTDTFGIGEPCGVCIFPTGAGKICGNTVYANQAKGRLPKYCGQEGQAEWQAQYGTEGDRRHRSDLAGYPRRQLGMSTEDIQALATAEAARRGITRRLKAETVPAPAPADSVAAADGPLEGIVEVLPESPVDALAELAQLIVGRVVAVKHEMDSVRKGFEAQAEESARELALRAEELDAEREAVAGERAAAEEDRAELAQARVAAESEIREAREAQLTVEGQLKEARKRIEELERAAAATAERHREELAEVRKYEEARYDKMVAAFAATRAEEAPAARRRDLPITDESVQTMAGRVSRGEITVREDGTWLIVNAVAPRPAAAVLDHMMSARLLVIGEGEPAPVALAGE